MPMHLHLGITCQGQVADEYKDVVLPAVAFAWHLRREGLLAELNLEKNMAFEEFWRWCMQPQPTNSFVGSLSNIHEAFEAAVRPEMIKTL